MHHNQLLVAFCEINAAVQWQILGLSLSIPVGYVLLRLVKTEPCALFLPIAT